MSQQLPLLLFSGGADSTVQLRQLLQHTPADVLYVKSSQHPLKIEMELKQQDAIITELEKTTHFRVRERYRPEVKAPINGNHMFQQVLPWMMGALATFNPRLHSEVQMAYLIGDDIMVHKAELMEAWKQLTTMLYGEPVKLVLPLMYYRKQAVYRELTPELRKLIWVCELPVEEGKGKRRKVVACKTCPACKTQTLQSIEALHIEVHHLT